MAEDFGKISQGQINNLAKVLSEAKSLISLQAEIIERVLAGEVEIGNTRIASLKKYFDIYSQNLDLVARKYSALNDDFLLLSNKIAREQQDLAHMHSFKASIPSKNGDSEEKKEQKRPQKKSKSSKSETEKAAKKEEAPTSTKKAEAGHQKNQDKETFNKVSDSKRQQLDEFTAEDLQLKTDKLSKFFKQSEKARSDAILLEQDYLQTVETRRQNNRINQLKDYAKQVKNIEDSILDLELLRHQNEQDSVIQLNNTRLTELQKTIKAEAEAQELINNIASEIAYASGLDFSIIPPETADQTPAQEASKENGEQPKSAFITSPVADFLNGQNNAPNNNRVDQESPVEPLQDQQDVVIPTSPTPVEKANEISVASMLPPTQATNEGSIITEAGSTQARMAEAKLKYKAAKAFEDEISKYRIKRQLEEAKKTNEILSEEAASRIEKEIAEKFSIEKLYDKKRIEALAKLENEKRLKQLRQQEKDEAAAKQKDFASNTAILTSKGQSFEDRKQAWQNMTADTDGAKGKLMTGLKAALVSVSNLATQLEKKVDEIASYKGFIDTRLQGSSNEKYMNSYWDQLVRDMASVGSINPFFKQEDFANNIKELVNRGIAFDLKQRAFLKTIQEKIANTFDVADGTLLRLIRIQQEDTTAGRLGMESALNSFLNSMYENSEYLSQVAVAVRGSLEEMESLMQGTEATEVEYQVQKWLGSLYSVGMSQNAINSISNTLGQIAAGQIEGITGGGAGNLLVMAANEAGLSIADILTDGINSSDTNKLLEAAVNYLAELSESAEDNRVVQQQLANVFGVKASDLKAATNLVIPGSTNNIYNSNYQYSDMLGQLFSMAGSMGSRTSMAELMTNFWENGMYSLASSMASNPVSYFIYKMATVLDSAAGGIALPFVNVLGSGVDLNTTVSDLMRVAAVGTGILRSISPLISGLGSSFSGKAMLNKLGITAGSSPSITPRGNGAGFMGSTGSDLSSSGYVNYAGNTSGSDIKESTIQESKDIKKQQMIEAKEEYENTPIDMINTTVLKIYELLEEVTKGDKCFRVNVDSYGLTRVDNGNGVGAMSGLGNAGAGGGAGGFGGAGGGNSGGTSQGGATGSYGGGTGVTSGRVSGSIDLGDWSHI